MLTRICDCHRRRSLWAQPTEQLLSAISVRLSENVSTFYLLTQHQANSKQQQQQEQTGKIWKIPFDWRGLNVIGSSCNCDRKDISIMENKGTRVRIQSKHGFSYSSLLSVEVIQDNLRVSWRTYPQKLGVDMLYLKELKRSLKSDSNIILIFQGKIRWCKLVVDKCVPRIMLTISEIEVVSWVIQCWSFSSALIIFIKNMRQQNLDDRIFKLHCTLSF